MSDVAGAEAEEKSLSPRQIWASGSNTEWSYFSSPADPVDCRWHYVRDVWALVDEDDGEVLARVREEEGLWVVLVPGGYQEERYIGEAQAKARAEEMAGPVNIVQPVRQNSAGIP